MGGWVLEICKMGLYMTFPVALFHLFNHPSYFEEWVTNTKRDLYPPASQSHHDELQAAIREFRETADLKKIKALEEYELSKAKQL